MNFVKKIFGNNETESRSDDSETYQPKTFDELIELVSSLAMENIENKTLKGLEDCLRSTKTDSEKIESILQEGGCLDKKERQKIRIHLNSCSCRSKMMNIDGIPNEVLKNIINQKCKELEKQLIRQESKQFQNEYEYLTENIDKYISTPSESLKEDIIKHIEEFEDLFSFLLKKIESFEERKNLKKCVDEVNKKGGIIIKKR